MTMERSPIEGHHALGHGESARSVPRRALNRALEQHSGVDEELALQMSIKAINDTSGPSGLAPTTLVLGESPQAGQRSQHRGARERGERREAAISECETIAAERGIARALQQRAPTAVHLAIDSGDLAHASRERERCWIGPSTAVVVDKRRALVESKGTLPPLSIDQVKLYQRAQTYDVHLAQAIRLSDTAASSPATAASIDKEWRGASQRKALRWSKEEDAPESAIMPPARLHCTLRSEGESRLVAGGRLDPETG